MWCKKGIYFYLVCVKIEAVAMIIHGVNIKTVHSSFHRAHLHQSQKAFPDFRAFEKLTFSSLLEAFLST